MKKQGLLLVLSLLMLGGVASCSNEEPPASHSITLPNAVTGAHVYASTTSAIEGTTVTVTVVMTDSTYQIDAVKLGDTTLTGKADENNASVYIYNFKMPDGNAAISVETSKIVKDHAITLVDNEYTYVYGLPKEADVGDSVTFGVRCLSGYELTNVSVKVGDEDVALTGDATQGYTFAMPDGNVTVETEALGAYFQITVDNEAEVITANDVKMTATSFTKGFFDSEFNKDSSNSKFLRAGQKAYIIGAHKEYACTTHYYVNGVEALEASAKRVDEENNPITDDNYIFEFTMPNKNAVVTADAELLKMTLQTTLTEHLSVTAWKDKDEAKTPITTTTEIYPNDVICLSVSSSEPEKYPAGKIDVDLPKYEKETSTVSTLDYDLYGTNGGKALSDLSTYYGSYSSNSLGWSSDKTYLKMRVMPATYVNNGVIKVNLMEDDMTKYLGQDFIGEWKGFEGYKSSWGSSATFYGSSPSTMNVLGNGVLSSSTSYLKGEIKAISGSQLTINDSDNKEKYMVYDGNVALIEYSEGKKGTDFYFLVKGSTTTSFTKDIHYDSTNNIVVMQYYETINDTKTLLGSALTRLDESYTNPTDYFVPNVTIELLDGTTSVSNGKYKVSKGDTVLYTVGETTAA